MGHLKKEDNKITKTFSFKVKSHNMGDILEKSMTEFTDYYNKVSDFVCEHLNDRMEDFAQFIPEKKRESSYYKSLLDPNWKNEPLWKIFTKKFSKPDNFIGEKIGNGSNCDNIIISSALALNPEGYDGNILGFSKSTIATFGYLISVVGNYKTKIRTVKPNVKSSRISIDSDEQELINNVIYEMVHNDFEKPSDFKDEIEYQEGKEELKQNRIDKLKILYNYFKDNEDKVRDAYLSLSVDAIRKNGGCKRKMENKSMTFTQMKYNIVKKEGCDGYILTFGAHGKYTLDLWGREDVIRNGKELVDFSVHGNNMTIKMRNGDIYIDITKNLEFNKHESSLDKNVGIDVNTKHMLLQTSIEDNGDIDGYLNLYKCFLDDNELVSYLNKEEYDNMEKLSHSVSLCPIEYDFMLSNLFNLEDRLKKIEYRVGVVLKELAKSLTDNKQRIYVQSVFRIREHLKNYIWLKNKFSERQKVYDEMMGFTDESTKSRETMDKRRFESPFMGTKEAQSLKSELDKKSQSIVGCRDNIVRYAYDIFSRNCYTGIGLENLKSSSFNKKSKPFPTVESLLKFHHWEGKTVEEIKDTDLYKKHHDKYNLTTDNEGLIISAEYSEKGKVIMRKAGARDIIIKAVHFAEVKDVFAQLSNNGNVSVCFVPPFYSSQMDSNTNKVYTTLNEKGKEVIVDKKRVRAMQETHINGLNADINAAKNICYMVDNVEWRNTFIKTRDNGYNKSLLVSTIKGGKGMVAGLKKLNATQFLEPEHPIILKRKRYKKAGNK